MRTPPPMSELPEFPVIAGTALLAVGVTVAWWADVDIRRLMADPLIRNGEWWRIITCILPHVDPLHLIFDVYWFWVFGSLLEEELGHFKAAGLVLLFGVGSMALEFAFLEGGVGLSGVVYGFFGMLWILARRDPHFSDAVDDRTSQLFFIWFVFCIVLTIVGILPTANIAHGGGLVLGVLVGSAMRHRNREGRFAAGVGAVLLMAFAIWGATLGRPMLNFSRNGGLAEFKWGYNALVSNRPAEAVRWFRDAVRYKPRFADFWYDLGIAYDGVGDHASAQAAYRRAQQLKPNDPNYAPPTEVEEVAPAPAPERKPETKPETKPQSRKK